ncbi:lytic transglycosylase domain-containing protein [Sphingomonas abietis]|uniref:Transglycosylase SLT domain-containing protein n=1 Tax=Sphingomonas abietis TaxID=3012344 RepID=A0ABY7NU46_9SPHN|nr:lytic transglycosylase domain-containing protein [Sphingomonas abietis]WBO24163.1 transglycosylase SLT domain-containing protein [Sphingomonas abietis]
MMIAPFALLAAAAVGASLTPQQVAWYRAQLGVSGAMPASATGYTYAQPYASSAGLQTDPIAEALVQWRRLRQSSNLLFQDYANFLIAHPGWPGESAMRKMAEQQIQADVTPPDAVIAFLTRFPPQTGAAQLRLAEALFARGRAAEAQAAARAAWVSGQLNLVDEGRLTTSFGASLTQDDQDKRMEVLLWGRNTAAAQRQILLVSPARRALYMARLAYQLRSPDAAAQGAALGATANGDAGYLVDRSTWLRMTGQEGVARMEMAQPHRLDAPAYDGRRFMEQQLSFARGAANDGNWAQAYAIASQLTDIYPIGADLRALPFAQRDVYTSLAWLAGTAAMQKLGRPADAIVMFRLYGDAAQSPSSRAKGYYWAGRASLAAHDEAGSQSYFANAAAFPDQFYGQLALERIGRPTPAPATADYSQIPEADRAAFEAREVVRAARILGQLGDWSDQSQFMRTIGASAQLSDTDHLLVANLARELGRMDLGVMAERAAKPESASDYVRSGFPTLPVPQDIANSFSFIHGIMRQESQFDRQAVSGAGARGMMQLMPTTAREQASQMGLPYDYMRLTNDPGFNMELGTAYFGRMMDAFGGNYVLAIAAYNAGAGNVRKWIATNGDPRSGGVDPVDWIEAIPFGETRGYVQNVLANAVVYDTIAPLRAGQSNANRLSYYLSKSTPG